jgi:N-acetylglucosaminyldiphosphoundecaprenol N-acetyl-beta-D-mannosaminyltransferase
MKLKYESIFIVGTHSPPFGFHMDEAEDQRCVRRITDAAPDILFVGLGAPKQEKWIYAHYKELGVPVCIGIGVTFEFVAGMVSRAPEWMQRHGLEWFWRLLKEPLRLWKRYLIDDMRFFWLVMRQKLKH